MQTPDLLDLSAYRAELRPIFKRYPAGNLCEKCAARVSRVLADAGLKTYRIRLENQPVDSVFGLTTPPFILAKDESGKQFELSANGFHETVQIEVNDKAYYVDALTFKHYGIVGVEEADYLALILYSDELEVTARQQIK